MGTDELDPIDVYELTTEVGDVFFLCSDGIHKEMMVERMVNYNDDELQEYLDYHSQLFDDNATLIKVTI